MFVETSCGGGGDTTPPAAPTGLTATPGDICSATEWRALINTFKNKIKKIISIRCPVNHGTNHCAQRLHLYLKSRVKLKAERVVLQ
jgi:hypothetical protein